MGVADQGDENNGEAAVHTTIEKYARAAYIFPLLVGFLVSLREALLVAQ